MKKLFTLLLLAMGFLTSYAQNEVDISVRIFEPTEMQAYDCDDSITIRAYFKNNGADDLDLTIDSNLSIGMQNSTDSNFLLNNQPVIWFYTSDSVVINNGDSLEFSSRTLLVKELYRVFDENGQNGFIFRENLHNGQKTIMLYANTSGIGSENPVSGFFEEAANFVDPDTTNDMDVVRIVVTCDDGISVKEINASTKQISVYPNPVMAGTIKFDFEFAAANEKATLRIMDITGRSVLVQDITGRVGVQTIDVNVSDLNAGIYQLEIATGSVRGVSKFTVAK